MKLKKWLLGFATFAAMVVICAVCAGAETYGDFEYSVLDDGMVEITDYNGSAEKVDIPEKIDGKSVTRIGANAFEYCSNITSITIPDSVTSIYSYAFRYCTSLKSITIPGSVTKISYNVFNGCTSLTAINVATENQNYVSVNGVLYNKDTTVLICYPAGKKDKNYKIPDGVTSIGSFAFSGCASLTSVTIPDGVTSIGDSAFGKCTSLTSITIPDGVTNIGASAFNNCSSLTSITIPNSVTKIRGYAFSGCTSLTSVTIPDSVTIISMSTFSDCTSLTSIMIPNSVTSIVYSAFYNCTSLTSITIPYSVTIICFSSFIDCTSLTSIKIPNSVTSIGDSAFGGCSSLTEIKVASENSNYVSVNGVLYNKYKTAIECYPAGKKGNNYKIPDGVTWIGDYAFYGCSSLTSVKIPNSVTSIGGGAFEQCVSLTNIEIPSSVTSINWEAFSGCTNLKSVTIPDSVTSIGGGAFEGCASLTSITIPSSVTSIGDSAFRSCTSLTAINVTTGNKNYLSVNGVLYNKDKTTIKCYPAGKKDKNYKIPDGVTSIGSSAFYGCTSLTSIAIPSDVTSIGGWAFDGCTSLTAINVNTGNKNYTSVNGVLFNKDKTELICYPSGKVDKSYTIPNSVKSIEAYAFIGCANLRSVTIPDSVTQIGREAFENCKNLMSVTIPRSVENISALTFGYYYDNGYKKIDNFKIYCYSGTEGEKYAIDNGFAYELLDKPTIANVTGFKVKSLTSTNVTLQWNKNANASGYEIEQYKDGKWVNVAKITSNATTSYTVKGLAAGTAGYKFRMRAVKDGVYSDYTSALTVNTNPYGVGGFKCSSKSSTSVTLKWNKGTTASGYQLQQYKDGKWVTIYTGTKATDTSYTVKKLKAGTAGYRFRIRAYKTYGNTKQYGSWSSEVKVNTNPYGVGGFKCSSKTSTSVTLKWNKGTTASGYQLQQYKNGKWVTIYTGTKATNTSYTVKGLKAGTAGYRFRIRAYKTYGNTKQYGSWSSEVKVNTNPYGVGGFKCSSKSSTSVTLKWNKGTTASGYQLQQYKNGKWVTVYTGTKATNTSYTVKGLKAGTAGYRFRIRAYKTYGNTKQYGSWSSEVKVNTNPYGVGGFKAKSTAKTSITLGWNKGTTASGYQLQQYKGGKWATVYTGTKATSTSCTVKRLKANTSYKFRIRAYKTYGNTKQYGSWSGTLTVKTKR